MASQKQFTIRYMLAVVFLWAVALASLRQYLVSLRTSNEFDIWFVLSGVTLCPAVGGLFLNMRLGFILAGIIAAVWGIAWLLAG